MAGDLNPIRARIAVRPEASACTAIHNRIRARQLHRVPARIAERTVALAASVTQHAVVDLASPVACSVACSEAAAVASFEAGLWCCPLARCVVGESVVQNRFTSDDSLRLVDLTGCVIKADKRGAIPAHLAPILTRLDLEVDDWLSTMQSSGSLSAGALGHHTQRKAEALRRGLRRVRNTCPLVAARSPAHAA